MTIMDDQPPGNMSLDLVEFCAALYNYCTYDRDTLLWFIFHLFDEDDSGTLEALEFKDLISFVYCRPLTPTVQALVEKHGVAPTGFISRDQFVKRCREAPLLVAPAFELQRALHETVLGTKFWREHAETRTGRTRADNDDVLLNEFRKMDKAYQPGAISASRGAAVPSRHRRASFPGEEVVGGLFLDFEAVRTESRDHDAPRMTWSP